MDMPGFSRSEQAQLAVLVGMHRRKIVGARVNRMTKLGVFLRLSAVIHRHRSAADMPTMSITINPGESLALVRLHIDPAYLHEHLLTQLDLANEIPSHDKSEAFINGFRERMRRIQAHG